MSRIDWHAGFVPAMKLEFIENENDLIFEEEHPVDKRGNWNKTLAYTGLCLKEMHQYEQYSSREFTMTIVCCRNPIKLMRQLSRDGIICT